MTGENEDLISRSSLIAQINDLRNDSSRYTASNFYNDAGVLSTEWWCVEGIIENAPVIDARPVVHGRWVRHECVYGVRYCSECDFELHINDTRYCPNCGAKMESGE